MSVTSSRASLTLEDSKSVQKHWFYNARPPKVFKKHWFYDARPPKVFKKHWFYDARPPKVFKKHWFYDARPPNLWILLFRVPRNGVIILCFWLVLRFGLVKPILWSTDSGAGFAILGWGPKKVILCFRLVLRLGLGKKKLSFVSDWFYDSGS